MDRRDFWREVFAYSGSVTPYVLPRVVGFGAFATLVWWAIGASGIETGLGVAPYEIIGVVLALLLVLRTNSGYDRWYEGRKLWGGIVNQCRNLALIGQTYGPDDVQWRGQFLRWTAAFPHACRHSLRGERALRDMPSLIGREAAEELARSQHMPMFVARRIAHLLRDAVRRRDLDRFAFIQAEHERALLIDHIGACERIMKTPLARVFSIKIRRFLFLYLLVLPFGVVDRSGAFAPLITMLVAYPLLSLDQIGVELQNPFSRQRLGHLPLEDICATIQQNVLADAVEAADAVAAADKGHAPAEVEVSLTSLRREPRAAAIAAIAAE